jgi:stage II sporulation protein D
MTDMQRGIAVTVMLLVALLVAVLSLDFAPRPRRVDTAAPPAPLALPGRRPARRPAFAPDVRVCLVQEPVERLEIRIDGAYRVQPVGSASELTRGSRLADTAVTAHAAGVAIGRQALASAEIEVIPETDPAIWVNGHQYRGRLRLIRQDGGTVLPVNVLPLEHYIASVVDSEMPAAFPAEARRAQAIVARTYVLYQRERRHPHFDVFADTRSQRYLGFQYRTPEGRRLAGETQAGLKVATDTAGLVCTLGGKLFCTYYSAVCGGRTVTGSAVFSDAGELPSVPCTYCREAPLYRWTRSVPRREFEAGLAEVLARSRLPFDRLRSMTTYDRRDGAVDVVVRDSRHEHRLAGVELRTRFGSIDLPSPRFTLQLGSTDVTAHGRGHGHGVGFCQWGARGQALAGRSALEIVRHYYPGARIARLEVAPAGG